jgi:ABC-type branched-subunit amino acid transport system substrate-binding protein
MMRIRSAVVAACCAVVLVACGVQGGSGGGTAVKGGGSEFKPSTSGPIKIGVLITDTRAEAERNGVSVVSPYKASAHAMIQAVNDGGGVAERKLEVVDETIDFSTPNFDSAFEAICQRFTKDNQVQAVVYDGLIYNQAFNKCLMTAGVPILYMGQNGSPIGDDTDLKDNPGVIAVNAVSIDRRVKSIMNKAVEAKFLASGSKLGVVIEDCPYNERAYDNTLKPLAEKAGVELVKSEIKCAHGYADNGPNLAQVQSLALKFKSQAVDSVIIMTLYENGIIYYFAQGAHAQKWSPQYLLFHPQGMADVMKLYPPDQLTKMRGFGGMPDQDVTEPPAPPAEQAKVRKTCIDNARTNGVPVQKITDQIVIYQACDVVRLLQQGLANSGGLGGIDKLVPGIEKVGTSFVSALTLDGATQFGPDRHDGMEKTAVSSFDPGCKCFTYKSSPAPVG